MNLDPSNTERTDRCTSRYHWALLVGPKEEDDASRGHRFHARDRPSANSAKSWVFEDTESSMRATSQLLVRVVIGKVLDRQRLSVPLQDVPIVLNDPDWNCVLWVKEALASLERDGGVVGTSVLDWQSVRTPQ